MQTDIQYIIYMLSFNCQERKSIYFIRHFQMRSIDPVESKIIDIGPRHLYVSQF